MSSKTAQPFNLFQYLDAYDLPEDVAADNQNSCEDKVLYPKCEPTNQLVLGANETYSLDCKETQTNNNVLVIGAPGTGKTRNIVMPNLLQATGSYVVSDPKGTLYEKYKPYLESQGYLVQKLDFTNPRDSVHYNFFEYINSTSDINKIAEMLMMGDDTLSKNDPFWQIAARELAASLISFLLEATPYEYWSLHNVQKLAFLCQMNGEYATVTQLDRLMKRLDAMDKHSYAVNRYNQFRVGAARSMQSILLTLTNMLGALTSPDIDEMMAYDELDLESLGEEKRAIFVTVSDTDRSMDRLANLFFMQAMNVLCEHADKECPNGELPVPVRFILDDFATNVKIQEMPRMISSFRSRNISCMLMLQSEGQLRNYYGADADTIQAGCDTYLYMGGNDLNTATNIAKRFNKPLQKILYMPVGTSVLMRKGELPRFTKNLNIEEYENTFWEEKHVATKKKTKKGTKVFDAIVMRS